MSWLKGATRKLKQLLRRIDPRVWRGLRQLRDDAARAELARRLNRGSAIETVADQPSDATQISHMQDSVSQHQYRDHADNGRFE